MMCVLQRITMDHIATHGVMSIRELSYPTMEAPLRLGRNLSAPIPAGCYQLNESGELDCITEGKTVRLVQHGMIGSKFDITVGLSRWKDTLNQTHEALIEILDTVKKAVEAGEENNKIMWYDNTKENWNDYIFK